jgi:flagellar protein FliL
MMRRRVRARRERCGPGRGSFVCWITDFPLARALQQSTCRRQPRRNRRLLTMAEASAAATAENAAKPKGKGKLLLFMLLGGFLLLGGGGAAWWFTAHAHAKQPAAPPPRPPLYLALDPPFVVNFQAEQMVRFLQVTVQLMSRDPQTIDLLKSNDPVIRDQLLLLFANQKYAVLSSREGQEALRKQALESVRAVVAKVDGHPDSVEAVYFTSFVMQ